jgi:hypothetical protein
LLKILRSMSEPGPAYPMTQTSNPEKLTVGMRAFYERERRRTIAKLRDLDRILGRRQTIPERVR